MGGEILGMPPPPPQFFRALRLLLVQSHWWKASLCMICPFPKSKRHDLGGHTEQ